MIILFVLTQCKYSLVFFSFESGEIRESYDGNRRTLIPGTYGVSE